VDKININNRRPVIVGGGIAGLTAGLMLSKDGRRPVIVEASNNWGGLLRSVVRPPFGSFDMGSHILSETGIHALDTILFSHLNKDAYHVHEVLPNGTFFNGVHSGSGFIDARSLPYEMYRLGLNEFFKLQPKDFNLNDFAIDTVMYRFGRTFSEHIFAPVLKRIFGRNIEELNSRALELLGMRRLLLGNSKESVKWKEASVWNDERLCFHTVRPGDRGLRHYYPRVGGMGKWVLDTLVELRKRGAELYDATKLKSLVVDGDEVTQVVLLDGKQFPCSELIWSASVYPIFDLIGYSPPSVRSPVSCAMALTNLVLTHPSPSRQVYMTCHDPGFKTFRVTNYQALEGQTAGPDFEGYRFTVEEMRPPCQSRAPTDVKRLHQEMCILGMADPNSTIIQSWQSHINTGFPVPTMRFISDSNKMAQSALSMMRNLKIIGRGSGRVFFTSEVLIDLYEQLKSR
jgi:hypothetical protein